jgi:hypothetical protein
VERLKVVPAGESRPLYSDLRNGTARELIEAKGSVTRDDLRQAVGQLLDYGRFIETGSRAVLVPSRPRPDLIGYLQSVGIAVIYPSEQSSGASRTRRRLVIIRGGAVGSNVVRNHVDAWGS